MSQHSQRIQEGPSVASIVVGLILTMFGSWSTAYILTSPVFDARYALGAGLGAGFTALIGLQTVERAVERRLALGRQERALEREEAAQREDRARQEAEDRAREEREWLEAGRPDPVATQPVYAPSPAESWDTQVMDPVPPDTWETERPDWYGRSRTDWPTETMTRVY